MRVVDVIARKRGGAELSAAEIEAVILGYARDQVPDYQVAAWLMAACLRGLSERETADLTRAMVRSGDVLDWTDRLPSLVDKHSSGGVGDKTTLVVVPLVAATGLLVAKMSGRGLGFTGGTLDKLESIPGLRVGLSLPDLRRQVETIGLAIVAQSPELAPADGKLYALRDATATVDSLPLIASSIMSKKVAAGAPAIVLDVKVGRGAFMTSETEARELARQMLALSRSFQRRARAVLSSMAAPLGLAVGNAVEVREAIAALRGEGPSDLMELALTLGEQMLLLAGRAVSPTGARQVLAQALASGAGLESLRKMIAAQGGNPAVVDNPELLPTAPVQRLLTSPRDGWVVSVDPRVVAEAVVALGGGRSRKEDAIDHAVGVVLRAKPGDYVTRDQPLMAIHARQERDADQATHALAAACVVADVQPAPLPLVLDILE